VPCLTCHPRHLRAPPAIAMRRACRDGEGDDRVRPSHIPAVRDLCCSGLLEIVVPLRDGLRHTEQSSGVLSCGDAASAEVDTFDCDGGRA
jgi:hypothetical protein